MALESAELAPYCSANMPTDDAGVSGGAIDLKHRWVFAEQVTGLVEVISASASDTQNCTVVGRLASGVVASETLALTGTDARIFVNVYERLESVKLASDAVGIVTVRLSPAGATFSTIPIGERGFVRLFRNAASEAAPVARFEKVFVKNLDDTLTLLTAVIIEDADPSAKVTFTLASAKDDSNQVANRRAAPGVGIIEPDTFDGAEKAVPGTDLAALEAIGIWVRLDLEALDLPVESSYTLKISGYSS